MLIDIRNRSFGLDLLRAVSIWMVILYHQGVGVPGMEIYWLGGLGVEFFFVLSGFLIGNILLKQLNNSNSFNSIYRFWVRRWFRILPLYYFILLIRFFLYPEVGINILWYIFFLQNNFYGISFFGVSWSLVIEEWFYMIAPFVVLFSNFLFNSLRIKPIVVHVAFIISATCLRYLYIKFTGNSSFFSISANPIFRLDSLYVGLLLAFIKVEYSIVYNYLSRLWFFIFSVALLFFYFYFVHLVWGSSAPYSKLLNVLGYLSLSVIIAFSIPYIENINWSSSNVIFKIFFYFITYTSILTYAIYLTHPFFFYSIRHPFIQGNFLLKILLTYFTAFVSYKLIEEPFLRLREKFR